MTASQSEALRIGLVNEVVPHDELMAAAWALAKRLTLIPEPSLRLNKAIAMQGIQAAGMHAGLLVEGPLAALVHSSHNEERQRLLDIQTQQGTKAYLEARDAPFQPEPMGPRSVRGREKRKAAKKETS
jgi:enoyl-CoA hydratase